MSKVTQFVFDTITVFDAVQSLAHVWRNRPTI